MGEDDPKQSVWLYIPVAFATLIGGMWIFTLASLGSATLLGDRPSDEALRTSARDYVVAGVLVSSGFFWGWLNTKSRWWLILGVLVLAYPLVGALVLFQRSLS